MLCLLTGGCLAQDGVGRGARSERAPLDARRGAGRGRQRALCVELLHGGVVLQRRLQVADVVDDVLDHLQLGDLPVLGHEGHQVLQLGQIHLYLGVLAVAVPLHAAAGDGGHGGAGRAHCCYRFHCDCHWTRTLGWNWTQTRTCVGRGLRARNEEMRAAACYLWALVGRGAAPGGPMGARGGGGGGEAWFFPWRAVGAASAALGGPE